MAPRASWKGYLKLSLVSCPVRLYPATSAERAHQLQPAAQGHPQPDQHEAGRSRARAGRAVGPRQGLRVRGQASTSSSRIPTSRRCRIESNHTMNIEAFVDEGDGRCHLPGRALLSGAGRRDGRGDLRRAARGHAEVGQAGDRAAGAVEPRARRHHRRRARTACSSARCATRTRCAARRNISANIPVGKPDAEMLSWPKS